MTSPGLNHEGGTPACFFQQQDEALLLSSLQEFDAQLPTEEAAREDVKIRLEKENLLFCHSCNSHNLEKKYGARVLKCLDCGSKTWVTAGTFFHHAKRVKPRLAVIWLMERGFIVSSSKLHKLTDIAQSSAFYILKRVAIVIESHMERNICEIPSVVFSKVIYKRSRETPARAHPLAEQEALDALEQHLEQEQEQQEQKQQQGNLQKQLSGEHQEELDASVTASFQEELNATEIVSSQQQSSAANITNSSAINNLANDVADLGSERADTTVDLTENTGTVSQQENTYSQLSQQEKTLYDLLSENPISFEELYAQSNMSVGEAIATLVILEIAGLVSSLPGNNYIRCAKNSKDTTKNKANNDVRAEFETVALVVENFIRSSFHGTSRKYLQNYLSTYWYHIDKGFWQTGTLFSACFRFSPVKLLEIISYVTPPAIKYCQV